MGSGKDRDHEDHGDPQAIKEARRILNCVHEFVKIGRKRSVCVNCGVLIQLPREVRDGVRV